MNAIVGRLGVLVGFVGAVVGVALAADGLARHRPRQLLRARVCVWAMAGGALAGVAAMEHALIGHDFSLRYVADNASRATPLLYTVATLWGALAGSILLWALVLGIYAAAMVVHFRHRGTDPMVGWATLVVLVVGAFFFALMLGPANPFHTVAGIVAKDGPGPNPLLQNNPLMAVHPPMLYLGYVGMTIPFAFAVAALVTGRLGEGWLVETRRWTLIAWGFLTVGIVLGSWWSYEVLGWGGVWAWDPVENASFLPWLTATAYLHSVMVQERRGMLRIWNLGLIMATFALTILGTFLTRSGVLASVHSFTRSGIGPMLLGAFVVVVVVSVGLIAWRAERLSSVGAIASPLSREASFLVNNVIFGAFAFMVVLGTVFPLVVEALGGTKVSVGRPYFDRMAMPVGLGLLGLMAVGPLLSWHRSDPATVARRLQVPAGLASAVVVASLWAGMRDPATLGAFGLGAVAGAVALGQLWSSLRRRGPAGALGRANGGMVVHLGVVMIAVALGASGSAGRVGDFRLVAGQSASVGGHRITYLGSHTTTTPTRSVTRASIAVDGGQRYAPAVTTFAGVTQAIGTPSVRSRFADDVYLRLEVPPATPEGPAVIGVIVQPLIMWMWIGGAVMAAGVALAAWPRRKRRAPGDPGASPATPATATPTAPRVAVLT